MAVLLALLTAVYGAGVHRPQTVAANIAASEVQPFGVEVARTISELTGVAISPLLGVTVSGVWQYYHPTPGLAQPWYAHPVFWGTATVLLVLVFVKDVIGTAVPGPLKKPFDLAELFENKLSALIACGAFVPLVIMHLLQYAPTSAAVAPGVTIHYASVFGAIELRWLAIPLAMLGFLVVWLAAHAINVLIVLCPFSSIDAALKLCKAFLLSTVVLSAVINPWFGAAVSLAVIAIAFAVAPWAFRLMIFGTLFGADILLPARALRRSRPDAPHAFAAGAYLQVPARTYGRLTLDADGAARFSYRPWLILPERHVALPPGQTALIKGVFYPSLLHRAHAQERHSLAVMFLPRYRTQEREIAAHFGIYNIQENKLLRGFQAIRDWFRQVVRSGAPKEIS